MARFGLKNRLGLRAKLPNLLGFPIGFVLNGFIDLPRFLNSLFICPPTAAVRLASILICGVAAYFSLDLNGLVAFNPALLAVVPALLAAIPALLTAPPTAAPAAGALAEIPLPALLTPCPMFLTAWNGFKARPILPAAAPVAAPAAGALAEIPRPTLLTPRPNLDAPRKAAPPPRLKALIASPRVPG